MTFGGEIMYFWTSFTLNSFHHKFEGMGTSINDKELYMGYCAK